MNPKLLASIAVFALLASVVSISIQSAYAADSAADKKAADAKKLADKKAADAKKLADKKTADAKKLADKKTADAKKLADKKTADAKKLADKKAADAKKDSGTGKATGKAAASDAVTVEMAKGTATDTKCGDKCFVPNNVQVKVGGTVTWKNVDTAAHTATDPNGAFDSSMVMAKGSFKHKFDTAGTYNYLCIVHPWMQGTVTVS
jgi:plastocyanin